MINEQQAFLNRLTDLADQAKRQYRITATAFLTPAEQTLATPFLRNRKISFSLEGGFKQAERKRCLFWLSADQPPEPEGFLAVTEIIPVREGLGHRDYLGALLGLGLKREQLGDIVVQADRAYVIHHPNLRSFFLTQLEQVGSSSVRCQEVASFAPVIAEQAAPTQLTTSVSSLRVDVVLGSIFHLSRSQSLEMIRRGQVQLDWAECSKPDQIVMLGQVLNIRGSGRARILQCDEHSRKGKIRLVYEQFT